MTHGIGTHGLTHPGDTAGTDMADGTIHGITDIPDGMTLGITTALGDGMTLGITATLTTADGMEAGTRIGDITTITMYTPVLLSTIGMVQEHTPVRTRSSRAGYLHVAASVLHQE